MGERERENGEELKNRFYSHPPQPSLTSFLLPTAPEARALRKSERKAEKREMDQNSNHRVQGIGRGGVEREEVMLEGAWTEKDRPCPWFQSQRGMSIDSFHFAPLFFWSPFPCDVAAHGASRTLQLTLSCASVSASSHPICIDFRSCARVLLCVIRKRPCGRLVLGFCVPNSSLP